MNEDARARLRTVLNPKSVAVIGASENPNKIGGRPLLYLSRFGYKGKVYPINPKRTEAQGFKVYPNLAALPSGCSFAPRCAYAMQKCGETMPAPVICGDGHVARCWRAEERIKVAA